MYKKIGETPLECLNRLRIEQAQYSDIAIPLTYAGRLDPMADGLLLVLSGDECKKKEDFLGLDKEYVCEILWGISTDTYDILGKVTKSENQKTSHFSVTEKLDNFPQLLQKFIGKQQQSFPPYSSKPVQGKALHEWAREGKIDDIELPSKEIEIKELEILDSVTASSEDLKEKILSKIALVKGDFRQEEIITDWNNYFESKHLSQALYVSRVRIVCSTGTYIRGLVNEIGKSLGVGATVLSLTRTRVGKYKIV